ANFSGGKGGTFFATPNAALTDATVTAITGAADKGRSFLLNHITAGKYGVDAGTDVTVMSTTGQQITPFSTKAITVVKAAVGATNPNGVIVTTGAPADQTKYAPIFKKDLTNSNGLIQVIGGVLQ
ncbi:MAG TPA: fasciclin domain-containing protein, partial [Cyclobacteriaceae bacterium]